MILTVKDIPFGVGQDNMSYRDAYLTGARAQLKKVGESIQVILDSEWVSDVKVALLDTLQQSLLDEVKEA